MRWTIETNGEGESGKSVLAVQHDDDNNKAKQTKFEDGKCATLPLLLFETS